jgi:hypothetical protein
MTGARDVPVRLAPPDARRYLQLVLAGLWLLDAALQYQAFMFTKGFAGLLAGAAAGIRGGQQLRFCGAPTWPGGTRPWPTPGSRRRNC